MMKKFDIKSVTVGILGTLLVIIIMGANSTFKDEIFGNITVKSITVVNDHGEQIVYLGDHNGGYIQLIENMEIKTKDGIKRVPIKRIVLISNAYGDIHSPDIIVNGKSLYKKWGRQGSR